MGGIYVMSAFDISGGVPPHVLHNDVDFSAHQQERYVMKAKNSLAMKVALAATLSGVVTAGGGGSSIRSSERQWGC